MKKSQLQQIVDVLDRDGEVSRNWCLSQFITRLSARIDDLERIGWKFAMEHRGRDYVYKVVSAPKLETLSMV